MDVDHELIQRARSGDEAAFGDVVRLVYEPMFRRVMSITRNEHDARDVCQEVCVALWQSLKDFRGDAKFSTWVYSIATRRAIDLVRKRRRWFDRFLPFTSSDHDTPVAEPVAETPDARDAAQAADLRARFERALAELPAKLQAVLALREVEGLSYEEIAETLQCRPGTVMSRLFHARRLLAEKLKDLPCD